MIPSKALADPPCVMNQNINITSDLIHSITTTTNLHCPLKTLQSCQKYLVHLADSPHLPHLMPNLTHNLVRTLARTITEATTNQVTDHTGLHWG